MQSRTFPVAFLAVLALQPLAHGQLLLTEISSDGSVGDYWEITNVGAADVDLSGYRWGDSTETFANTAAWALPSGTNIAAGESIVFTKATENEFRTWWGANLAGTVKVFWQRLLRDLDRTMERSFSIARVLP